MARNIEKRISNVIYPDSASSYSVELSVAKISARSGKPVSFEANGEKLIIFPLLAKRKFPKLYAIETKSSR